MFIYTDGSCIGNPGPGGWAFIILKEQNNNLKDIFDQKSGGNVDTTNNRMEMTALLKALKYFLRKYPNEKLQIYSDSNLIVQTINQGWKKKANQDLWLEIDKILPNINFKIDWVKAHDNNIYNNYCDQLALKKAEEFQKKSKSQNKTKQNKNLLLKKSKQVSMF